MAKISAVFNKINLLRERYYKVSTGKEDLIKLISEDTNSYTWGKFYFQTNYGLTLGMTFTNGLYFDAKYFVCPIKISGLDADGSVVAADFEQRLFSVAVGYAFSLDSKEPKKPRAPKAAAPAAPVQEMPAAEPTTVEAPSPDQVIGSKNSELPIEQRPLDSSDFADPAPQ